MLNQIKVLKFGGTSQSIQGYSLIRNLILETLETKNKLVIVLSAVSGTTNNLEKYVQTKEIKYIDEIIDNHEKFLELINYGFGKNITLSDLYSDLKLYCQSFVEDDNVYLKAKIIGFGEVLSTNILYEVLKEISEKIELLDSYKFIHSKKETSKLYPSIEFYCSDLINDYIKDKQILITQGFIATTPNKNCILLGRGGSDTTGALIANTLNAKEYQVWTDVDGIYTGDPKIISEAKKINEIAYEYVQEMAGMGAKVMHPYSIIPCAQKNIPIIIKNTFRELKAGTIINNVKNSLNGIASQKNITLFKITSLHMWNGSGFVYDIFKRFSDKKVNVGIITTSQFSISATTEERDNNILKELKEELEETYDVDMISKQSIVSIISNNLKDVLLKVNFNEFEKKITHFSSNNMTVSFVIDEKESDNVSNILHKKIVS